MLDTLLRVMRDFRVHYDAHARQIGLTMSRARALSILARMEGATQSELAEEIGIEAPTLKRQIDALEEAGYIERRPHPGDVRKKALHLTDRARAVPTTRYVDRVRAELLQGISPEEQALVCDVLARLTRNLSGLDRP